METELFKELTNIGCLYIEIRKTGDEIMYSANVTWVAPGMGGVSASIKASGASTILTECLQAVLRDYKEKKTNLISVVS